MTLTLIDWFSLFTHFLSVSLLAVGGAISAAPEMHRFLVTDEHWIDDATFANSITLAQAAPGPNVLFVAAMGMNVGLAQSGGAQGGWMAWAYGALGALLCMFGMLLPSGVLTLFIARWSRHNRDLKFVKAFKAGMAPIVIGLLISTGYVLNNHNHEWAKDWPLWALSALSAWVVWRTKIHLLWLLGLGAILGALGLLQA
jgi:chromate transporter